MLNLGIFSEIYYWLVSLININPWISAVLIGFFSSFGVFFSFAPSVVLYVVLFAQRYNPLLIAVCAGFGAMTGELSSYYLGYIGKKTIDLASNKISKDIQLSPKMREFFIWLDNVLYTMGEEAVFLFALTPLPDDLLLLYLGAKKYPLQKIILPCWLGKTGLIGIYSILGTIGASMLLTLGEEVLITASIIISIASLAITYLVMKKDITGNPEKLVLKIKRLRILVVTIIMVLIKLLLGGRDASD